MLCRGHRDILKLHSHLLAEDSCARERLVTGNELCAMMTVTSTVPLEELRKQICHHEFQLSGFLYVAGCNDPNRRRAM